MPMTAKRRKARMKTSVLNLKLDEDLVTRLRLERVNTGVTVTRNVESILMKHFGIDDGPKEETHHSEGEP